MVWALLCISVTRKQAGGDNKEEKVDSPPEGGRGANNNNMRPPLDDHRRCFLVDASLRTAQLATPARKEGSRLTER